MIALSRVMLLSGFAAAIASGIHADDETARPDSPRVVLVGDSIQLSYAPSVAKHLAGRAIVISAAANGGDSSNVLKHLEQWVVQERPTVVHFNCGIHDTKKFKSTGAFQVSPEQYEANLREIVARIRKETGALVLFATTTPILDDRAARHRRDRDYELLDASVRQYNMIAKKVMQDLAVPINDLHSALATPASPDRVEQLIGSDGVHLQPQATELVGKAVAAFVGSHLPSRHP